VTTTGDADTDVNIREFVEADDEKGFVDLVVVSEGVLWGCFWKVPRAEHVL